MQINSTQTAGLLAFVPAALAAALASVAAVRSRRVGGRAWAVIALIHGLLATEVLAMTRYRIDDALRYSLRQADAYADRRAAQAVALLLVGGLAVLGTWALARLAPTRSLAVATSATAAPAALFLIESVSLHAMDGLLYGSGGPILILGWLWLACGWTTTATAAMSIRRTSSPAHSNS